MPASRPRSGTWERARTWPTPPMTAWAWSGRRADADPCRVSPPVPPPMADRDPAARSEACPPSMRALSKTAARLDLHLHLEEPRSAVFRDLALPHDLDPGGCQGLAESGRAPLLAAPRPGPPPQNQSQAYHRPRRQQSRQHGRLESPLLVHLVPPASRPAAPQGDPLPPEG